VIGSKDKKPLDGMSQLKKLNLKEVSEKTHISIKTLNDMINSNFDKLSSAKTVGFLRILEKEYGFNFDEWHASYIKYIELDREAEIKKELLSDFDKKSKLPYVISALIIAIVIVYFVYPKIIENNKIEKKEKESIDNISNTLEKDIKESMINNNIKLETIKETLDIVQEINETNNTSLENKEQNSSIEKIEEKKEFIQEEETKQATKINDENIQSENIQKDKEFNYIKDIELGEDSSIKLTTGNKIWVGLSTNGNKKDFVISKEKEIFLEENTIFFTGHGFFTIHSNDNMFKYRTSMKKYFYVKDEVLYQIDKKTFNKLDKENVW
jgi:cytoskeletal protein RodZ